MEYSGKKSFTPDNLKELHLPFLHYNNYYRRLAVEVFERAKLLPAEWKVDNQPVLLRRDFLLVHADQSLTIPMLCSNTGCATAK